jgi:alkanesulfonate monooxygenase SsuD/methylene tetrahydromethanopterin reductase-like flavin-dependent oxidoreductase (luciferase family)
MATTATPLGRGSISMKLYPHNELGARDIVAELCHQSRLAAAGGFDGVLVAEHHGGIGGYVPNPQQIVGFILEDTALAWAGAGPLVLPLRPTAQIAEETAWLAARHPGRVGIAVCIGAARSDFEIMDVSFDDRIETFKRELPRFVQMLQGDADAPFAGDRAIEALRAGPIPVLSAAVSNGAAKRAARSGAGLLLEGLSGIDRLRELCTTYAEAGGQGLRLLNRRVWLGNAPKHLIDQHRKFHDQHRDDREYPPDQTVASDDPDEVAERVADILATTGADAVCLRVQVPGLEREETRAQIQRLGESVLPRLRTLVESTLSI